MHLSKKVIYFGIIGFSVAMLIFMDYPSMLGSTGTVSLMWLVKMVVDIMFAGMALVRLAGPAFFASDEDDDEVSIHEEDLHFSDTALFGLFMVDLVGNLCWHAYLTVQTTGGESFYYSLWTLGEIIALFFAYILWSHAVKTQRRMARKSRETATGASAASPDTRFRKAS